MFERYTENARKSVFFARNEASQFACPEIQTEHLLLGILRTDTDLAARLFPAPGAVEAIRARIEQPPPTARKISLSTDLPLSPECKRILTNAAKHAERAQQKHIGTAHLLLALAAEESCLGAKLLMELGVTLDRLHEVAGSEAADIRAQTRSSETALPPEIRDLIAAARGGALGPLIGRERELEQALQILSRRNRNSVALIGETGVGRTAILEAVAGRIAEGSVPAYLADRPVFALDAAFLAAYGTRSPARQMEEIFAALLVHGHPIICLEGLFDLPLGSTGWSAIEAMHALESHLAGGAIQCVATSAPAGMRLAIEKAPLLMRHFEVVQVLPPAEAETVKILLGVKKRYEDFHGVIFTEEAVEAAVHASGRFLRHRRLPDRALDLLDESGARAGLHPGDPAEVREARKRIRQHVHAMQNAMARHEFDKARHYSDEERKEREKLERLLEARGTRPPGRVTITDAGIEEVIAQRLGVPVESVRRTLREQESAGGDRISSQLAALAPSGTGDWLPLLAGYLDRCSPEEAERLAAAILKAKGIER